MHWPRACLFKRIGTDALAKGLLSQMYWACVVKRASIDALAKGLLSQEYLSCLDKRIGPA